MSDGTKPRSGEPGTTLGRYRVLRRLGAGAMGVVVEAEHIDLRKRVALKLLREDLASDPVLRERFLREGHAAARIRHPHVVDVTDVDVAQAVPYLVMELLEGETLAARIRRGAIDHRELAGWMLPVCAAVHAAHAQGVLHRDLKPDNIFLARTAVAPVSPKVLDFGIAKLLDEGVDMALTDSTAVLGTPYYLSPEQARGARDLDPRCDQYALGVILYEASTGRRPFEAGSVLALVSAISRGGAPPPTDWVAALPAGFEAVVQRAMSLDPDARFDSVRALGAALLPFVDASTRATWEDALQHEPPALERRVAPAPTPTATELVETLGGTRPNVGERLPPPTTELLSARRWIVPVLVAVGLVVLLVARQIVAPPTGASRGPRAGVPGGALDRSPSVFPERDADVPDAPSTGPTQPSAPTPTPRAPTWEGPRRVPLRSPRPRIAPGQRVIPLE